MIDHADLEEAQGKFSDEGEAAFADWLDGLYVQHEMERMMDRQITEQFNLDTL